MRRRKYTEGNSKVQVWSVWNECVGKALSFCNLLNSFFRKQQVFARKYNERNERKKIGRRFKY